tara:strand:+ start:385 stop:576 length:192 start_codon:yes stop_codon:yes gene_type:complete
MDYNTLSAPNLIRKIQDLENQIIDLKWSLKVREDQLENLKWDKDSAQHTIRKLRDKILDLTET